jgi:hypothetical protein
MQKYLFKNDNTVVLTESTGAITQRSNSVDAVSFIVPKIYNETYDMSEFDGLFEYKLPISNEAGLLQLVLTDDNYKEDYLLFSLPETTLTTAITKECGEVEFSLTFVKAELDNEGNTIERVRQSAGKNYIKIVPIVSWLSPSESQLSSLAAMYLENKKSILALQALAEQISETKADDIRLDIENSKVILTSEGNDIGNGINLDVLNAELVNVGGNNADNGNILINRI